MYTKITDPTTNKTVSIHSLEGKKLIQNYINFLKGGSVPIAIAALTSPIGISIGGSLAVLAGGAWVVTYYKSKNNHIDDANIIMNKMNDSFDKYFVNRELYDDLFIKPNGKMSKLNDTENSLIPSIVELSQTCDN